MPEIKEQLGHAAMMTSNGGGMSTKKHYDQGVEHSIEVQCPVILNGIEDVVTRGDLMGRSLFVELPRISDEIRRTEKELDTVYEAARPGILGAILDAVSTALAEGEKMHLERKPRQADVTQFVAAAETGLGWDRGTFAAAYARNRASINEVALESSGLARALIPWLEGRDGVWEGTAAELLDELRRDASGTQDYYLRDGLPKDPTRLSGELRRIAENLRQAGYGVDIPERRSSRGRILRLWIEDAGDPGTGDDTSDDSRDDGHGGDEELGAGSDDDVPPGSGDDVPPGVGEVIDPNTGKVIEVPW